MALAQPSRSFVYGQKVRLSVEFRDASAALYNPATILLQYQNPNGVTTTLTYGVTAGFLKDADGQYHADIVCSVAGVWYYRGDSTDGVVDERAFEITSSAF